MRKRESTERFERTLEEARGAGEAPRLADAVGELARELQGDRGVFARVILPLLEKVLVPIVAAALGALGVYYVELAKRAEQAGQDAGRSAAVMELDEAARARELVLRYLPDVTPPAPVSSSTRAGAGRPQPQPSPLPVPPRQGTEARLAELEARWVQDQRQGEDDDEPVEPPPTREHLRRALREAELVQEQVQVQRERGW